MRRGYVFGSVAAWCDLSSAVAGKGEMSLQQAFPEVGAKL